MVKKIISCADIHIPNYRGIEELKDTLTNFIEQCREIVDEEGSESVRIVCCGDLFHNKLNITNESILAVNWFLCELGKLCKTIVIAGNHDMLMNNMDRVDSISPFFEISDMNNVLYLDKYLDYKSGYYLDDDIVWCLYSSFEGFNQPDIKAAKEQYGKDKTYVGLIHADINGAVTALNHETENGVDPKLFKGCDFVIAGHIHKRQNLKYKDIDIVYCSSINQKNFGETVTGHGFVLWTLNENHTHSYEYIDVSNGEYGFYKFSINDISDIENDKEELLNY